MSRPLLNDEQVAYLETIYIGRTNKEIAAMINERFGTDFSFTSIRSYKINHGYYSWPKKRRGWKLEPKVKYTPEQEEWLISNRKKYWKHQLADMFNERWPENPQTYCRIKRFFAIRGLLCKDSHFTGADDPRVFKGIPTKFIEEGKKHRFQKGNKPHNTAKVGDETLTSYDNYIKVKVAEPNVWKFKHILVWEAAHGPVPKGYVVAFKDGNRQNCSLDNLICCSKATHAAINTLGLERDEGIAKALDDLNIIRGIIKEKTKNEN